MKDGIMSEDRLDLLPFMKDLLTNYFLDIKEHAREKSQKIAWCSSAGPVELLRALDFKVYFPEKHWDILGNLEVASDLDSAKVQNKESAQFHSYLIADYTAKKISCSKGNFFETLSKMDIPEPDVLVFNTIQGTEVKNWLDSYSRTLGRPVVGLYTPQNLGEISSHDVKSVVLQLRNLILTLETISGNKLDFERLKRAVELSRKCAELWRSCLQTAAYLPAPWSFFDHLLYMIPSVVLRGTMVANGFYQLLFTELAKRVKQGSGTIENEKVRLLWDGLPLWLRHDELNTSLKSMNACIVASTYCNTWDLSELDETQALNSMARAYSGLYVARNAEYQCSSIRKLKNEFRVNGILFNDTGAKAHPSSGSYMKTSRCTGTELIPTLKINRKFCYTGADHRPPLSEIKCFIEQLRI